MATAATHYRLPDVDLFASGTYHGDPWTAQTVLRIAANATRLGPKGLNLHVAPGVAKPSVPTGGVGHDETEEDLEWLERTDLPAAGQIDPDTVYTVPDPRHPGEVILRGDLVNVPAETAAKIRNREYTRGSAELYHEFFDDFENKLGPALRRFVILGGTPPQVKRLRPLPMPVPMAAPIAFAERARAARRGAVLSCFAERTVMDRAALIKAIQAACPGMSQATIELNTDDALKEWVANLPKPAPPAPPTPPQPPTSPPGTAGMDRATMIAEMVAGGVPQAELDMLDEPTLATRYAEWKATQTAPAATEAPVAMMGDAATMSREELIAELVEKGGQDATALEAMTDDELKAMYTDLGLGATAETPAAAEPVAAMGEKGKRKVAKALTEADRMLVRLHRMSERAARAEKKAEVEPVCRRLVASGFTPAFVNEWVRPTLERLDNESPVVRFSEGGKTVRGTALQAKIAAAKALDPKKCFVQFGERLPGSGPGAQTSHEAAVRKAESHFATIPDDAFKSGTLKSRAGAVAKFSERATAVGPDKALVEFGIK